MQSSEEVKGVLLQIYAAMSKGDVEGLEQMISRQAETLVIGTDPREWWRGFEEIHRVFGPQIKEMNGVKVKPGQIEAFEVGQVAWTADQPTLEFPDGNAFTLRGTAIFLKEPDQWKLVQWHVSVGATNEETLGKELTV